MKKIYNNIIIIFLGLFLLTSCNDDFMQQDPNELAEGAFLRTEQELYIYLDQFYKPFFMGHGHAWGQQKMAPWFDNTSSPLVYGERYTDNLIERDAANGRLRNTDQAPAKAPGLYDNNGGYSGGWYWDQLKNINYFLRYFKDAEASVSDPKILSKWLAEAYYFKVAFYYEKLYLYGDVPWYDLDLNITSEELYKARDSREFVVDKCLELLEFAVNNIQVNAAADPIGRVNIDDVNLLKSKFCLFEGTYRKYHQKSKDVDKFFEMSAEASKAIIDSKRYQLYRGAADGKHYRKLFTMQDTEVSSETIRARVYDGTTVGHATTRYALNNTTRHRIGAPRGLVDDYLCINGLPIHTGGSEGQYVDNPLFKGYDGMWTELDNRDPRLTQTIAKPGEDRTVFYQENGATTLKEAGLAYPGISYRVSANRGVGTTVSGYMIVKHLILTQAEYDKSTTGTLTAHISRYAEVLLNYAEARAELNKITQDDLDVTINDLRDRAGFDFVKYPGSKLTLGSIAPDPRLDAIYGKALDYSVSPILREIRRERRVELYMENKRYEDLMRWKAGKLIEVPLRGMKVTAEKAAIYDGSYEAGKKVTINGQTHTEYAKKLIKGEDYFLDKDGFIIIYPKTPDFPDGIFPWNDRRYLTAIPRDQIALNPNLEQNPGW